ncbi:hypothetical protein CNMCM8980_010051 [Aspergillus fumigatiaffinis]|uniref:Uncharacterized protein n=1 Tax=Aspergillus fumigatiaffinis TaxID=340414 RepID=A0A8H4EFP1_9EURO|nr:hypothetical protein CNMCM5878_003957 [Aspergillus fumigatiaffinis]KAF4221262.1 hypothetical protein CNMCM6457_001927 [Aspergillus fumigatiaffinis]KAF4231446.1 hypothetical protein CNMCM6805_000140 [Aspergillus fumigatiaffinis]KAF4244537.1 hypothetical protein CNMCM8980_010051 [Aspergillus fumigatiaffinis]
MSCQPAITTVSVGQSARYTIHQKLSACANNGFKAAELFYDDLEALASSHSRLTQPTRDELLSAARQIRAGASATASPTASSLPDRRHNLRSDSLRTPVADSQKSRFIGPTVATVPVRVRHDWGASIRDFARQLQDQATDMIMRELGNEAGGIHDYLRENKLLWKLST